MDGESPAFVGALDMPGDDLDERVGVCQVLSSAGSGFDVWMGAAGSGSVREREVQLDGFHSREFADVVARQEHVYTTAWRRDDESSAISVETIATILRAGPAPARATKPRQRRLTMKQRCTKSRRKRQGRPQVRRRSISRRLLTGRPDYAVLLASEKSVSSATTA